MSVACQDVVTRAIALNVANSAFQGLPATELLARLNLALRTLNAKLAQDNRLFYLTTQTIASTPGISGRSIDLASASFALPVERVLLVYLPPGTPGSTEVALVDIQDLNAELAPRMFAIGTRLVEVNNEWSGASGAVTLTVYYVYKQVPLSLTGDLTQTLQIPDEFAPYFDYDLGIYFHEKDLGRSTAEPEELARLTARQEAAYQALLQYLDHLHGTLQRRFILPVPTKDEKA